MDFDTAVKLLIYETIAETTRPPAAAQRCAIHFAVPAAWWWDDIVYT